MSSGKALISSQKPKIFIDKTIANSSPTQPFHPISGVFPGSKKKHSLDHSTAPQKENFSMKNLNYFISPRSSSEQIFKNIKALALLAKSNTVISPKPILNNSNSINKDVSHDKENFFLKYLKESSDKQSKPLQERSNQLDEQKRDKNTAEIIESLETLKNKYKTLKEMNFLKCNKNSEMICPSKFSKVTMSTNMGPNKPRLASEEHAKNSLQANEVSTINTLHDNSKKSHATKKNTSGNASNILSTNSNSESEIQQRSNEKVKEGEDKALPKEDNNLATMNKNEALQKNNLTIYKLNKEKVKKIFQNYAQKNIGNQTFNHPLFARNLSIPENIIHTIERKKISTRRNSFHLEPGKPQISENLMEILKKTKKMMSVYKMKEFKWINEKRELNLQIEELKRKLSQYELI